MLLCAATCTEGAVWEYYDLSQDGEPLFYDKQNIKYSKNIVTVYQKETYNANNLFWKKKRLGTKYDELRYTVKLLTIDCSRGDIYLKQLIQYDSNGNAISTDDYSERTSKLPQSQDTSLLYGLFCNPEWVQVTTHSDFDIFVNAGVIHVSNSNANVTFWMKAIHTKTKQEVEKELITIICEKNLYVLRYLMKYASDGSVSDVYTEGRFSQWEPISNNTIMSGLKNIVCDNNLPRQDLKDYLRSLSK